MIYIIKYDVIVIGGGFAGCAAAISAAREGARVLLIEKSNSLSGAASNALVMPFMQYYTNVNGERIYLSSGIFGEICETLKKEKALMGTAVFDDEYLKLLLNRILIDEGVEILFHCKLYESVVKNGEIKSVKVACVGGNLQFTADCFVDATGDAELAYLSGCPCRLGRDDGLCQPMTLCFRAVNVDVKRFFQEHKNYNELYKLYKFQGKIKNPREDILIFKTLIDGVVHFNTTRVVKKNPVDPFDLTKAEIEAREQVYELFDFLKKNALGFENASIISTASQIGVRESRMIEGEYVLTKDDLILCRKFDDRIAACNYDIDIHNPEGSGTSHYYFPDGEYYTIPYRSLLPKGADNLIVAGRCISSDHDAQASYRIMPTVCCIGEAAGVAAALSVKGNKNFRDVDVKQLQTILKNNNGFIG